MYRFLNNFFLTKFYDNLPKFISRKLFKIFKVFFVQTSLNKLPTNNHPSEFNYSLQKQLIKESYNENFSPFISYIKLLEFLKNYETKSEIKFYDFGPCNIDLYLYLTKKIDRVNYIYFDQDELNTNMEKIKFENNFQNLIIDTKFQINKDNLDIVYFGSSIQYVNNYKETLKSFFKHKPKYIIISQTPFYSSNGANDELVIKQINLHPVINYAYLFNFDKFILFMKKNGYDLKDKNFNRVIKFLNFKNFNKNFKFVDFYDLVFRCDFKS